MFLNGEYAGLVRKQAEALIKAKLPPPDGAFLRGDHTYQEICNGYSPGFGTSCTFLPHWMLWKLGVSAQNSSFGVPSKAFIQAHPKQKGPIRPLVNWTDPARGLKLVPGDGVSVIAHSNAYVPASSKVFPSTGDVIVIQSKPYKQTDEHVFVFLNRLSDTEWETGETGQAMSNAAKGAVEGKLKHRKMKISGDVMTALASDGKPDRFVDGWLDISKLDYIVGMLPFSVD